MTDSPHRHPTRIRTFAADLEAKRKEQGTSETPVVVTDSLKEIEPVPLAATPKSFKTVTPQEEEEPVVIVSAPKPIPILKKPIFTEPTKIPSFHELQKNVAIIQENITAETTHSARLAQKKKSTKESKPERSARPNIGYDATVITDRQSDHFKLFPAIIDSLKEWFKAQKKKRAPKYTVAETERRKGVIQRATTKTGTLFTADNETLREQIRKRRSQIHSQTSDGITETMWSPFTEAGYPLLEAPDEIQNIVVAYKHPKIIKSVKHPIAITEPSLISPAEIPEAKPTLPSLEEVTTEEPRVAGYDEANEVAASLPEEADELFDEEYSEPLPPEVPTENVPLTKQNLFTLLDTNTLTVMLLLTIVAVVAVVFVSRMLYVKFTETASDTVSLQIPSEPILATAKLVGVPLTVQTLESLPRLLDESAASSSASLVEYVVVSSIGDEVSASYLFELLGFKTIPSLRQSLLSTRFASVQRNEPAVILTFTDTDTVHGGLLAWEATMADDMRPLYNLPLEIKPAFVDETVAGKDARVLRHDGEVVLLYSMVTSNLAIISNDPESFAHIVELGLAR